MGLLRLVLRGEDHQANDESAGLALGETLLVPNVLVIQAHVGRRSQPPGERRLDDLHFVSIDLTVGQSGQASYGFGELVQDSLQALRLVDSSRCIGDPGELIEIVADAAQLVDGSRVDPSR